MTKQANFKSLAAMKRAIREGRKFASEGSAPEDPTKESVPAISKENVVDQADYNIPTDGVENKDNLNEARPVDATTPLDTTIQADEADITAKKESPVEETEKQVNLKGASIVERLKKMATNKEASVENVAANISLKPDVVSKVANIVKATEKKAAESCKVEESEPVKAIPAKEVKEDNEKSIKIAALKDILLANKELEAEQAQLKIASEQMIKEAAAKHDATFEMIASEVKDDDIVELMKLAYAEGAQDAQVAAETGAMPPEQLPVPETEADEQTEIMSVISELLQSGQIDEQQAQQLAEMASQAAMSDGQPELSDEEMEMALMQAIEQGLITEEQLQAILGQAEGDASAVAAAEGAPADVPNVAAPASDQAAADAAVPEEAMKTASVKLAKHIDIAEKIVKATYLIKKAAVEEGAIPEDQAEVTPEDLDVVLANAEEAGEVSPEDAEGAADVLATAISDEEGVSDEAVASEDEQIEALAELLAEEGVTPEELEAALASEVEGDIAEEEAADEEIDEEALAAELEAAGVSPEELEAALAEEADEEIDDEEPEEAPESEQEEIEKEASQKLLSLLKNIK